MHLARFSVLIFESYSSFGQAGPGIRTGVGTNAILHRTLGQETTTKTCVAKERLKQLTVLEMDIYNLCLFGILHLNSLYLCLGSLGIHKESISMQTGYSSRICLLCSF